MSNNDSSSSHPPTPVEECSAKKISRKGRKGIAAEKNWTREEIETLITLWEGNEIFSVQKEEERVNSSAVDEWRTNRML